MSERAVGPVEAEVRHGAMLAGDGLAAAAAALQTLGRRESPAAAQGLLLGLWARAAGQSGDRLFAQWLAEFGIDSIHGLPDSALTALAWLFRTTLGSVTDAGGDVAFSLALADEDAPWRERLLALRDWCDYLLYGYGLREQAAAPDAETAEVLTELAAIARISVPELQPPLEDEEANEQDFSELVEFLRIAPLLLLGPEGAPLAQPVAGATRERQPAAPAHPHPCGHDHSHGPHGHHEHEHEVLPAAGLASRGSDGHWPFRQDADFFYLSGFPEPDAWLVMGEGLADGAFQLFVSPRNPVTELWDGPRFGPEGAVSVFGADAAWPLSDRSERLPQLLAGRRVLYAPWQPPAPHAESVRAELFAALACVQRQRRKGVQAPLAWHDSAPLLAAHRVVKGEAELQALREAARLSVAGHLAAMRAIRAGRLESELEAELGYAYRRGGGGHAFNPIVAGGQNACVLHYTANTAVLRDGELVLIDSGAELGGYCGDITTTWPVSGQFSPAQGAVYGWVLEAQRQVRACIRPGLPWHELQVTAVRVLTEGMRDLGLLTGEVEGLIEQEAYKRFYPHQVGHWLGLDVHDAGPYRDPENPSCWLPLREHQVLTVEPGLYLPDAEDVPVEFRGIGVRIEDDVCVTADGHECLTAGLPRAVAEIEAAMAEVAA